MTSTIGFVMLAVPFVAIFFLAERLIGTRGAIGVFVCAAGLIAWIYVAAMLITMEAR